MNNLTSIQKKLNNDSILVFISDSFYDGLSEDEQRSINKYTMFDFMAFEQADSIYLTNILNSYKSVNLLELENYSLALLPIDIYINYTLDINNLNSLSELNSIYNLLDGYSTSRYSDNSLEFFDKMLKYGRTKLINNNNIIFLNDTINQYNSNNNINAFTLKQLLIENSTLQLEIKVLTTILNSIYENIIENNINIDLETLGLFDNINTLILSSIKEYQDKAIYINPNIYSYLGFIYEGFIIQYTLGVLGLERNGKNIETVEKILIATFSLFSIDTMNKYEDGRYASLFNNIHKYNEVLYIAQIINK